MNCFNHLPVCDIKNIWAKSAKVFSMDTILPNKSIIDSNYLFMDDWYLDCIR